MAYTPTIREKAIKLRKGGYSYSYIVKIVPVAKSTLSEWLIDIPFIPNQHTLKTIKKAQLASGAYKHQIRVKSLKKADLQAKRDIVNLSKRDMTMLGLGLYIGEGGKTGNITRIINSDPRVIKLAVRWFKIAFGIEMKQIGIRLFIYPDNNEQKCIEYWSNSVGIPKKQFFKSMVDLRTNKKLSNKGKLPFGTAHVSVRGLGNKNHGVYLHRLIMAWIKRVL